VIFVTLEDETGISNIVVWEKTYEKYRRAVVAGRLLRVTGHLQREGMVVHIIAQKVEDISPMLDELLRPAARPDAPAVNQTGRRPGGVPEKPAG